MNFYPELLKFSNGERVKSKEDFAERRKEILDVAAREEYGYIPNGKCRVTGTPTDVIGKCCSGHAVLEIIDITVETENGSHTFPLKLIVPTRVEKPPVMVLINFRPDTYDMYGPTEEIIDNGFAMAMFCYADVTSDDGDFENGIAKLFPRECDTDPGKISLWAYSMSRVIDYLETRDDIDCGNIIAAGHSRLGKTTLWCAANDERIRFACVNGSGCSGAAYERAKHEGAETIEDITRSFPYWFCGNYPKHVGNVDGMPFDQHMIMAACAPRFVMVGDATLDAWADQYASQLCCLGASPAWELYGKRGFTGSFGPAKEGDFWSDGCVAYHLRDGIHYLGRPDWLNYMAFIKKHISDPVD